MINDRGLLDAVPTVAAKNDAERGRPLKMGCDVKILLQSC
jgi:hypothetical protein